MPGTHTGQSYSRDMVGWSQCPAVESDLEKVHGAWVFRNTRLPISIVFECLARGATIEDIVEWYGGVTREQIEPVGTGPDVKMSIPESLNAIGAANAGRGTLVEFL